jgi:hypothetical protein
MASLSTVMEVFIILQLRIDLGQIEITCVCLWRVLRLEKGLKPQGAKKYSCFIKVGL